MDFDAAKRRGRLLSTCLSLLNVASLLAVIFVVINMKSLRKSVDGGPEVIEANAVVLRDEQNRERVGLRAFDGGSELAFLGDNGRPRMILNSMPGDNTGITIWDKNDKARFTAFVNQYNRVICSFNNDAGRPVITLADDPDRATGVYMKDGSGTVRLQLKINKAGYPTVMLADKGGKPRVAIFIKENNTPTIEYFHD